MQETELKLREQLCSAITRRSLVMFEYGDLIRVVEPHRLGVNSAGHAVLSGWLRAGHSRSDPAGGWRTYLLGEMRELQQLDAPFAGTRPGYAAHDARMQEIYCELTPSAVELPADWPSVVREATSSTQSASSAEATESTMRPPESARLGDGDAHLPDAAT